MESRAFIRALQLTDSFFPVGAFAYSDGLETAAASGQVHDAASLREWMDHFIDAVLVPAEGLAVVKCMRALHENDIDKLNRVDNELTAIRPASAVRRASVLVGKRLLSVYESLSDDPSLHSLSAGLPESNAATAHAIVFFHLGLTPREAVMAFGYNRLAGIVSAGLRLISIGQNRGQVLLTKALDRLVEAADRIVENSEQPLRSFSPLMDIQQMNHQYVYSRLFRS
jgi:urease accessory protein